MAAAYDTYDYPSYWEGREYEHASEVIAIKAFLAKINEIGTVLEIGAGYGRLAGTYIYRAQKVILSDPSAKLLKIARETYKDQKNVRYIQSSMENLAQKIRKNSIDLVIMVRVIHHLGDAAEVIAQVNRLLKNNGYFILEFANKAHFKANIKEFFKGNITFPLDIFPKEIKGRRTRKNTLPFLNYHPDIIKNKLEENGFEIIEKRSVSNIRSTFIKQHVGTQTLITISRFLQIPLSYINFGPSIFILARKKT